MAQLTIQCRVRRHRGETKISVRFGLGVASSLVVYSVFERRAVGKAILPFGRTTNSTSQSQYL